MAKANNEQLDEYMRGTVCMMTLKKGLRIPAIVCDDNGDVVIAVHPSRVEIIIRMLELKDITDLDITPPLDIFQAGKKITLIEHDDVPREITEPAGNATIADSRPKFWDS